MGREKIAVYGTGGLAKKLFLRLSEQYEIAVFYNSNEKKWGTSLMGIPIRGFERKEHLIVIASKDWKEISDILMNRGLQPIRDFIPSWMLIDIVDYMEVRKHYTEKQVAQYLCWLKRTRKVALLYGNCQTGILLRMLTFHPGFRRDYTVLEVPAVFQFSSERKIRAFTDDPILWSSVDLLIYQKIGYENRFSPHLASDEIIGKVGGDCQKVCILNVFFDGYFPQLIPVRKRWGTELHQSGLFPFGDRYVDRFVSDGWTADDIVERVQREDFLQEKTVRDACEASLNELRRRESVADVQICDYIEEHYQNKPQLFYSTNHPRNSVLYEYANRILSYLGYCALPEISEEDQCILFGSLKGQDIPVYPAVAKALGWEKAEQAYFPNRYMREGYLLQFADYVREYIRYAWMDDQE